MQERREIAERYARSKADQVVQESILLDAERAMLQRARRDLAQIGRHRPSQRLRVDRLIGDDGVIEVPSSPTAVSRGEDHVPQDKAELAARLAGIPDSRDDLQHELAFAERLIEDADWRETLLHRTYARDLHRSMQKPGATPLEFDHQYLRDRAQAMQELDVAEDYYEQVRSRLADVAFSLRSSNFGSLSEDGAIASQGSRAMEAWFVRRKRERHLIGQFRSRHMLGGTAADVAGHATPPSVVWTAGRSIPVGESLWWADTGGRWRNRPKIKMWRTEMDRLRCQPNYGAKDTGYSGNRGVETEPAPLHPGSSYCDVM